ncbi:MAG: undecaprenyl-diphosphate phosphatase [Clostridia bacterium]|nr:undecaprenyl-diphosphate phosphatase [Clostridia bacterium]
MKYIEAVILGLCQGLTEFLPVSSSGHLMLLEELGIGESSLLFNLMLHLATLLSVCIIFRKKLWYYIRHPLDKDVLYILIATVPTAALAFVVRLFVDEAGLLLLPFGFFVTSVLLYLSTLKWRAAKEMDGMSAFITGLAQGIATIGGISRSGSTISVMLMLGIDREKAGDFTFLLSIPIILGSALVEILTFSGGFGGVEVLPLALAMVIAFASGLFAIKLFLSMLKNKSLLPFSIYTLLLAIASFVIVYVL